MPSGDCSTRLRYRSRMWRSLLLQLCEQRIGLLKLQAARRRWTGGTSPGSPAVVGFEYVHDVVLALALLDQTGHAIAHGFEVCPKRDHIVFGGHGPVSRDGRIEIERQRAVK